MNFISCILHTHRHTNAGWQTILSSSSIYKYTTYVRHAYTVQNIYTYECVICYSCSVHCTSHTCTYLLKFAGARVHNDKAHMPPTLTHTQTHEITGICMDGNLYPNQSTVGYCLCVCVCALFDFGHVCENAMLTKADAYRRHAVAV